MLKIIYPICCGMDVHKNFVVACIASTDNRGVTSYKSKRFSTYSSDLRLCRDWLADNNCKVFVCKIFYVLKFSFFKLIYHSPTL